MSQPGPLMDSAIARKVWRAIVVADIETGESYMVEQTDHSKVPVPAFSTDLDEAHKVVEFFQAKGWTFRVRSVPEDDNFQACFYRDDSQNYRFMKADTMPMVICEAAIAAINGTNIIR
jgi:hypothetical protein